MDDATIVMPKAPVSFMIPAGVDRNQQAVDDFRIMIDALELLCELWPAPDSDTVRLTREQWMKLRRVLVASSRLWTEAYGK